MKLQAASKKEVLRMSVGCAICLTAEIAGLLLLSFFGIGQFSYRMVFGAAGGTIVAILNFIMMCLMVQNATGIQDQKLLRAKVQGSYNLRLLVQAGWIVFSFLSKHVNIIAAAIPLLFPTAVIYYLQMTGKLMPSKASSVHREPLSEDQDSEDQLNSFEA